MSLWDLSLWVEDDGYEPTDPKHSTFHERYAEHADRLRKQRREDTCTCRRHAHDPECNRHGEAA